MLKWIRLTVQIVLLAAISFLAFTTGAMIVMKGSVSVLIPILFVLACVALFFTRRKDVWE
jgi:hypothetical protein